MGGPLLVSASLAFTQNHTKPGTLYLVALSIDVLVTLILSAFLIAAFVGWEHVLVRSPRFSLRPLMPLEIWTRGRLAVNLIVVFVGWCAFQPMLYHSTLFFQEYQELAPVSTMIRFLPTAVSGLIVCGCFAILVPYVYGWSLIAIGTAGTSV